MAKNSTQYVCQGCGAIAPRWLGRCPSCGGWNTLVEETVGKKRSSTTSESRPGRPVSIGEVSEDAAARLPTGIAELDRVLGGGAVLGSVVLVGGDPGVGKSTLLLQALAGLSQRGARALYASGEESVAQVALRARRILGDAAHALGDRLQMVGASDVAEVEDAAKRARPSALVVDSVQVLRSSELESAAGTVSQLREVTARLVDLAKREQIALFLVGHVTKDGALAGPKVLEHLVDVVLAFEGERGNAFRALRASKNRYGSATEVGVFEMAQGGLAEVPNPSELFLAERPAHASGSVVAPVTPQEGGARAVLVEVQALVGSPGLGSGRRTATGIAATRLAMILAVLERKIGFTLTSTDVFANVAGGLSIDEPAIDLPLAIAVASAARDRPCARDLVAFGEIGLAGEVRGVARGSARLGEAASMGFKRAIVPASTAERISANERSGVELIPVRRVDEAIRIALED
ncbi:MAG: DNA repair protein RadA [Deltaproteobacteria bacterium]|nr:DNA repair protein RadA [Deltaproteobacteria bacterium]